MDLKESLLERSNSQCELCSLTDNLSVYAVPPIADSSIDKCILLCEVCLEQLLGPDNLNANHWRCLGECMWSEYAAVQVMAWRILNSLSNEGWAQDYLGQLYLDEENQKWAETINTDTVAEDNVIITKDSNGTLLENGDSVTLIKDLVVKGANFTAKRGTIVRKISLTSNPEHIEGRVNGTQIVLLTCFLKKVI